MPAKKPGKKVVHEAAATESDKRSSGNRIPIQLLVDYKCDGHYLFDFCRDLGAGGVFIETNSPQNHGTKLDLTFTIPDSKETLKTSGKVIWVQTPVKGRADLIPGMGVQFEAFNNEQRAILEEFVRRYKGDNFGGLPGRNVS
jgi:type IV pilus assembly protein PilZ